MKTNDMKIGTIVSTMVGKSHLQHVLLDNKKGNKRRALVLTHPTLDVYIDMHTIVRYKFPSEEYQYDIEFTDEQLVLRGEKEAPEY